MSVRLRIRSIRSETWTSLWTAYEILGLIHSDHFSRQVLTVSPEEGVDRGTPRANARLNRVTDRKPTV